MQLRQFIDAYPELFTYVAAYCTPRDIAALAHAAPTYTLARHYMHLHYHTYVRAAHDIGTCTYTCTSLASCRRAHGRVVCRLMQMYDVIAALHTIDLDTCANFTMYSIFDGVRHTAKWVPAIMFPVTRHNVDALRAAGAPVTPCIVFGIAHVMRNLCRHMSMDERYALSCTCVPLLDCMRTLGMVMHGAYVCSNWRDRVRETIHKIENAVFA